MNSTRFSFFAFSILIVGGLNGPDAFARGNGSSGGGTGIVCKDLKIGPTSPMVLDFYEAVREGVGPQTWNWYNSLFEGDYIPPTEGWPKGIAVDRDPGLIVHSLLWGFRFYPSLMNDVNQKVKEIGRPYLWDARRLKLSDDVHLKLDIPKGCRLIPLAYRENGRFYTDRSNYPKLMNPQKAVLWLHEAIYAMAAERTNLRSAAPIRDFFQSFYAVSMMKNDDPGFKEAVLRLGEDIRVSLGTYYLSQDELQDLFAAQKIARARDQGQPYDYPALLAFRRRFEAILAREDLSPRDREVLNSLLPGI